MAEQPEFAIQKIYLKDISFESPSTPAVFLQEWEPMIDVDFDIDRTVMDDDNTEVVLKVTVTAKLKEQVVFIVEAKEAGIFLMKNIPESDKEGILKGVCPNILFPYVRQRISQLVTDGGFPPLYLAPINFEAMYMQEQQQANAAVSNAN
jgi:preprotein translocase subunit SecB